MLISSLFIIITCDNAHLPEDAVKHPDFFYYYKRLLKLGVSEYNQRCFWRWMAMGALNGDCQNGGWMSDYDTFPLNFNVEEAKEIEKKPGFKSYNKHTPNFLQMLSTGIR